jgi:hypothetical protein
MTVTSGERVRPLGYPRRLGRPVWAFLALLAALQVGHIVIRGTAFQVHLDRAVYQYAFSMIFFGPAVAGLGAFAGGWSKRTEWVHRARPRRAALSVVAFCYGCALAVYLGGLAVVVGITAKSGTPLQPTGLSWQSTATAILAIAGYLAAGALVGWVLRPAWAITSAVAGSFAITMVGWFVATPAVELGGGAHVYAFGGITGPAVMSRVVLFGGLLLSYVLWVCSVHRPYVQRAAALAVAPASLVLGFSLAGDRTLAPQDLEVVCAEEERICVPLASSHALDPAVELFAANEYLTYLRAEFPAKMAPYMVIDESGMIELLLDAPRADRSDLAWWVTWFIHGSRSPRCAPDGYGRFESRAAEAERDAEEALSAWESELLALAYPPAVDPDVRMVVGAPLGESFEEYYPLLPPADLDDPDARYFLQQVFEMLPDCN